MGCWTRVHCDALAIDDGEHNNEIYSDVEVDPEATTETTDASGTNCASNLHHPNDEEFFDDFWSHDW